MSNIPVSMKFVDREEELEALGEAYSSGRAELVVLYGRRRVGKTFLLSFFARERGAVYLVVNYSDRELALRDLVDQLLAQVELPYPPRVDSFTQLYELLARLGRRLVVVDEFQRLHGTGGVQELQSAWDRLLSRSGLMLVLSGSSVGMMERIGLSAESPLYGRATRVLHVKPLGYREARAFMPGYAEEDRVRGYAVFGGTPGYLALLDEGSGLLDNIVSLVLRPGAPLREEPRVLLSMELREPSRYLEVLRAVAGGATRLGEIADKSGVKASEVGKYLRVLERELGLVERRYPLLEEGRRGRARYYLADNFFRFWFSMVFPYRPLLELGLYREVAGKIWAGIDSYASHAFEEVAMQHFALLARRGAASFTRIGRWWRGDVEIDFVAVDEETGTAYFAEAKWSGKPVDRRVLYRLAAKAQEFPWRKGSRREVYVLYSRSGFTFEGDGEVWLFTLGDVKKLFEKEAPRVEWF